jgi:hypothetical protein
MNNLFRHSLFQLTSTSWTEFTTQSRPDDMMRFSTLSTSWERNTIRSYIQNPIIIFQWIGRQFRGEGLLRRILPAIPLDG